MALIALNDTLTAYDGLRADKKVVHDLTPDDKATLRLIGTTVDDVYRAKVLERCTEHDTAAAAGLVKIRMGTELPHLEKMIEGVCFGATSEDTMGPVFGIISNCLFFGNLVPRILDFTERCLEYVTFCEQDGPLVIPGETHQQVAEPTTFRKRIITNLCAVFGHLERLVEDAEDGQGKWMRFKPFSGKFGGAIGNLTNISAAYPGVDWLSFSHDLVEHRFGLTYEEMTFQSSTFGLEADHFSAFANMLTHLVKMIEDFMTIASCPTQGFVKRKVVGTQGSSVMLKSNPWGMEGAVAMLLDAQSQLFFLAQTLPRYPREGNMARSYLMRTIGRRLMPVFIALDRIEKEMIGDMKTHGYVPNLPNIGEYLDSYPTLSGSTVQTLLKVQGIDGDAYREIERIAINKDGTYATPEQYHAGLEEVMSRYNIPESVRVELRACVQPICNIGMADTLAHRWQLNLCEAIEGYRGLCAVHPKSLVPTTSQIETEE